MKHLLIYVIVLCLFTAGTTHAQTWVSLNGPQIASSVRDISITTNGTYLYVADANYVLKSTDGGTPWTVTTQPYSSPLLTLVKPDDDDVVLVAKNGELGYNADGGGGASWVSKITDGSLVPLRLVAAVNDNNMMLLGRTKVSEGRAIHRSSNGGSNWSAVTAFTAVTDIHDFACYPNSTSGWGSGIVWAGGSDPDGTPDGANNSSSASTSGLWSSTDYGASWTADRLGNRNIRSVAIVPKTSPTEYVRLAVEKVSGGNDVVWRNPSLSDPEQWTSTFSSAADVYMVRLKISNDDLFLATSSGVYRSTDDGQNWSQKNTGLGTDTDVLSIAGTSSGNTVFAGTTNSLYKSTDNGDNWFEVGKMNVSSVEGKGGSVWAISRDNGFAGKTTNGGSTWSNTHVESAGAGFSGEYIYRVPSTGYVFAAGALDDVAAMYRSTNSGGSFVQVYHDTENFGVGSKFQTVGSDIVEYNNWVYAGGGALLNEFTGKNAFKSEDDGEEWDVFSFNIGESDLDLIDHVVIDYDTRYAILGDGSVYKTVNQGQSWGSPILSSSGQGRSLAINANVVSKIYASRNVGLWRSTNSGTNWSQIRGGNDARVLMDPTYPSSGDNIFVLAKGSSADTLYRSTDGGATGTNITSGLPQPINDIRTSPTAGFLYAATAKGVYARDLEPAMPEGFQATTPQNNHPTMTWVQSQEADIDSYQVFKYGYTSCEWVGNNLHCSGQTSPVQVGSLPYTQTTFVDVTENLNSGTPGNPAEYKRYYVVAKDKADATALVSGPTAPIEFLVTNYDDPEKAGVSGEPVPTVFFMDQNYPNPFNPVSTIRYGLPEDAHVTMKIFDLLGREVVTLLNQFETAGYKSIDYDASALSSGVYFCKLVAGSFVDVKKMIVTK